MHKTYKITIKDVAAFAGVSPSTVYRTCKNNPFISEETKERVRRAMAELGYEPNFQASNLANQNSRTIGIILPVSARYLLATKIIVPHCLIERESCKAITVEESCAEQ